MSETITLASEGHRARAMRVIGGLAFVPLTKGKEAIIDIDDIPFAEGRNWYAIINPHTFYAVNRGRGADGKKCCIMLHRIVMQALEGYQVDHIDGNGLNNRRENLRLATRSQNQINTRLRSDNTSGFKGVTWSAERCRWTAQITLNGKTQNLGRFNTIEDARAAYLEASTMLHGEFRRLS